MLPHGLEDVGHLLTLPLGTDVVSDALLQELQASLVLGDPQQLHSTTLIRRETGDLSDQIAHKLGVVGELALGLGGSLLEGVLGGLVAFVETDADFVTGSHDAETGLIVV